MLSQRTAKTLDLPTHLTCALRERKLIPFAGAGVSMHVKQRRDSTKTLFPNWIELLQRAAKALDNAKKNDIANFVRSCLEMRHPKLMMAAEHVKEFLPGPEWHRFLKESLDPNRAQVHDESLDLARLLWALGSRLVITTNYDRTLQWSCPYASDLDVWRIQHTAELTDLAAGRLEKPVLWHLHGEISDAARLILTPDGYSRLYSAQGDPPQEYEAASRILRQLLGSHTFLFVGFSFQDDRFGDQLRWLSKTFSNFAGNHFALIHQDDFSASERLSGIPVTPIVFEDYGEPLLELLKTLHRVSLIGTYRMISAGPIRDNVIPAVRAKLAELLDEPTVTVDDSPHDHELVVRGSLDGMNQLQDLLAAGTLNGELGISVGSLHWTGPDETTSGFEAAGREIIPPRSDVLADDVHLAVLSDDVQQRCREAFLDLQLDQPVRLREIFALIPEIQPIPNWLLAADEPASDLVDKTIEYVAQRQMVSGRPVLSLFIGILRDRHARDTEWPSVLERLRLEVDTELSHPPLPGRAGRQAERAAGTPHISPDNPLPFVDRRQHLDHIVECIVEHSQSVGIFGMPGVGKTALAKAVFSRVKSHFFEDGYSWYEVKGKSLAEIIRQISRDFHVEIPEDLALEEKKLALRSFLQGRKCLILLDDVSSNPNVASELIGLESPCIFVVTGNRQFDVDSLSSVVIKELPLDESVEMFKRLCCTGVRKPDLGVAKHAKTVCRLLGCHPLAMTIYAGRVKLAGSLAGRDVDSLHRELKRLQLLSVGDRSLRASFMLSYKELSETDRWLFALLGAFAGDEFSAAAVNGISQLADADNRLMDLVYCSLVRSLGGGRYSLHPLLKEFARERFDETVTETDHDRFHRQLAAFYFAHALEHRHPVHVLDVDSINILGCLEWCNTQTDERNPESLSQVIAELLDVSVNTSLQVVYLLARLHKRRGNVDVARRFYDSCLNAAKKRSLTALQGACLRSLGEIHLRYTSDDRAGLDFINQARRVLQKADDIHSRKEHIYTLNLLAVHYYSAGDYQQARQVADESLAVRDDIPTVLWDGPEGLSAAAAILIRIHCEHDQAEDAFAVLKAERDNLEKTIDLPVCLGHVGQLLTKANPQAAADLFRDAFSLFDDADNYGGCAWMKKCLGELSFHERNYERAFRLHLDALMFREHTDEKHLSAAALVDLTRICYLTDNVDKGEEYWSRYQADCRPHHTRLRDTERTIIAESLGRFARSLMAIDADGLSELLLEVLLEAEQLYESADNVGGVAYVHQLHGDFFLAINERSMADGAYEEALARRESMHDSKLLAQAFERIGDAYANQQYLQLAATNWRQALRTFEQIDDERAAERLRVKLQSDGEKPG